jgi:hypothetical protein
VAEARFFRTWEDALPRIELSFVTWEEVVEAIADGDLATFYSLCRRFGGGNG